MILIFPMQLAKVVAITYAGKVGIEKCASVLFNQNKRKIIVLVLYGMQLVPLY